MSAIDDYHDTLRARGLDLGAPTSKEHTAGYDGSVREYQHGFIYSHPATGIHEVHGGILSLYQSVNGPGVNPATGARDLGFPTSDEKTGADGRYRLSEFEWGAILWVSGTGGVVLHGEHYREWKRLDGELGALGWPLTGHIAAAEGQVVYFERGALYAGGLTMGRAILAVLTPPLIGKPELVDPAHELRLRGIVKWTLSTAQHAAIAAKRPGLFTELWRGRLVARRVRAAGVPVEWHPLGAEPGGGGVSTAGKVTI